jgi:hypothetical protein
VHKMMKKSLATAPIEDTAGFHPYAAIQSLRAGWGPSESKESEGQFEGVWVDPLSGVLAGKAVRNLPLVTGSATPQPKPAVGSRA